MEQSNHHSPAMISLLNVLPHICTVQPCTMLSQWFQNAGFHGDTCP